jgi:hypothetical protein
MNANDPRTGKPGIQTFLRRCLPPLLAVCLWIACKQTTEPKTGPGSLRGTVRSAATGEVSAIRSAFVFWGDSLLATSDAAGVYLIASLREGAYLLRCSAAGHRDTTAQVMIAGGKTTVQDFSLVPDFSFGKVFGEFEDGDLFNDSLKTNPSMADWDAKTVFDAATGATIQFKTFQNMVPERRVVLGDSLLVTADAWGQYYFKIRTGTYSITGTCDGYESVTQIVSVEPNGRQYANFFLPRIK